MSQEEIVKKLRGIELSIDFILLLLLIEFLLRLLLGMVF